MYSEILFAGFGGQGVILAGKILCIAAMKDGKNVSHIPSYGAEMRGGTANCCVVISDGLIASPVTPKYDIAVVMNTPSLLKFESAVRPGGKLLVNSSLIDVEPTRTDIEIIKVDANDISEKAGSHKAANMAMLGKLIAVEPELCSPESLYAALDVAISERNRKFNPVNIAVMKIGGGIDV